MTAQFARGPQPRVTSQPSNAPHAALLIDFDNVTMGIRSDLTKELKNLLNSDIIKGKVAVQRAYADWRRYPQYIVPLAENSVDLIFAPAYGSSKKNATDIRLAIDALELVFTRPEIGTFILLSGDSDFSSLVLKLKEYGKYVIGVGIRESSSDLLVQNCDEYYSYSGLTGLTREGDETPREKFDPWELVEIGIRQMTEQKDVMRSDRLKQILLELDPNFDEKSLGFPKFNRFLQEAAVRGLLQLKKMENGQFEVASVEPGAAPPEPPVRGEPRRGRGRGRAESQHMQPAPPAAPAPAPLTPLAPVSVPAQLVASKPPVAEPPAETAPSTAEESKAPPVSGELRDAYELLQRATSDLTRGKGGPVRDSDVKRRMLELRPGFDEGTYGFSKFSRFLRQAHDAEVINLNKVENGSYEVSPGGQAAAGRAGQPSISKPEEFSRAPAPESSDVARERIDNGDRSRRGRGRDRNRDRDRGRDRERGREPDRDRDRDRQPRAWDRVASTPLVTSPAEDQTRAVEPPREASPQPEDRPQMKPAAAAASAPVPSAQASPPKASVSLGFRRGSRRGGPAPAAPPPILAGQTIGQPKPVEARKEELPRETVETAERVVAERKPPRKRAPRAEAVPVKAVPTAGVDAKIEELPLPTDEAEIVDRLAGYKGVGRKSAEAMVQAFGPEAFRVLHEHPERVRHMLGGRRAEQLLRGWQHDHEGITGAGSGKGGTGGRKTGRAKLERSDSVAETAPRPARRAGSQSGARGGRKAGARAEQ